MKDFALRSDSCSCYEHAVRPNLTPRVHIGRRETVVSLRFPVLTSAKGSHVQGKKALDVRLKRVGESLVPACAWQVTETETVKKGGRDREGEKEQERRRE